MKVSELVESAGMSDIHMVIRVIQHNEACVIGGGFGCTCKQRYGDYEISRCWIVDNILMVLVKNN